MAFFSSFPTAAIVLRFLRFGFLKIIRNANDLVFEFTVHLHMKFQKSQEIVICGQYVELEELVPVATQGDGISEVGDFGDDGEV